jgi:hypothetical protein
MPSYGAKVVELVDDERYNAKLCWVKTNKLVTIWDVNAGH